MEKFIVIIFGIQLVIMAEIGAILHILSRER